jgi:hypothetical protein
MGSLLSSPEKMGSMEYLDSLSERIIQLRIQVQKIDPSSLGIRTGSNFRLKGRETGEFDLSLWGREVILTYPELVAFDKQKGEELPPYLQALLLYYFNTCDGTSLSDRWISFSELPDGKFYNQAFQGYTGHQLSRIFQNDLEAFELAAKNLDGENQLPTSNNSFGDASFIFQVLPKVPILAVYWLGDEDFPSSCQLLFDASIKHCLPTDACAIIGSTLTHRLIAKKG